MIECMNFRSCQKGNLLGFADFFIEKWGVEIKGSTLCTKDGKRWVNFPSKEFENPEGEVKFVPLIRFREKNHMFKFTELAKEAIDKWCLANGIELEAQEESGISEKVPF